jgi:hypothetical protein
MIVRFVVGLALVASLSQAQRSKLKKLYEISSEKKKVIYFWGGKKNKPFCDYETGKSWRI